MRQLKKRDKEEETTRKRGINLESRKKDNLMTKEKNGKRGKSNKSRKQESLKKKRKGRVTNLQGREKKIS